MRYMLVLTMVLILYSCSQQTEPETTSHAEAGLNGELSDVYEGYKNAVLNGNGEGAAYYVSSQTIIYYDKLLDLVQNADSSKLVLAGLFEKFTVLAIRQTVDWARLRAMNGKDLFIYAIQNGMIGKNISKTSLGDGEYKNDHFTKGELMANKKPTGKYMLFYREDGRWRLDLLDMLRENGKNLDKMMGHPELNETQRMVLFFKQVFGREPSREIWLPVKLYNKI